ncbi:MAG: DUF4292 domain-containing protein [Paludibacteraceae bacterium]|nr:DUF4292 domain-containing protein [Paludibacteraceae bacterium]
MRTQHRLYRIHTVFYLIAALVLAGCGTGRRIVNNHPVSVEPEVPKWHTCLIQNAKATIVKDGEMVSANVTMQTVRDSMLVISIMPMLGLEMIRLEATPAEVIGIDKIHGQFAKATFAELNRQLTPQISWEILQQLCSAELPTGAEKARLQYSLGDEHVELIVNYPERKTDVPVRMQHIRIDKYTQMDISKWL